MSATLVRSPAKMKELMAGAPVSPRKDQTMQFKIHDSGQNMDRDVRDFVETRVLSKLSRTRRRIRSIDVYIEDVNGPRGGADHLIRVVAGLNPTGQIIVRQLDLSPGAGIGLAAERTVRAVRRELGRRRTNRLRGAQKATRDSNRPAAAL